MSDTEDPTRQARAYTEPKIEPNFRTKDTEKLRRLSLELRALTRTDLEPTDSTLYIRKMRDNR